MLRRQAKKKERRRMDLLRMKARARRVARNIWSYPDDRLDISEKLANHIKCCSCWMCGNQRKWHGVNMQERREFDRVEYDLSSELMAEAARAKM